MVMAFWNESREEIDPASRGHDLTLADVFACRLFIHNPVKIGRSPARNLIR